MAGLQGAGKTTMCGKLALYFKKQGKNPMLVACDIYRPAAKDQLKVVGESVGAEVFTMDSIDPVEITQAALKEAARHGNDIVIVDTAGRLHIDSGMMEELSRLKEAVQPTETLLVVDAMAGQDAVNAAKAFNEEVALTGVILTKVDGDARGGAALSVKDVTWQADQVCRRRRKDGGSGTVLSRRMAGRILGMGDVLSLIEKAEQAIDEKKAMEQLEKMKSQQFDLNDFLENLQQLKGMGSMQDILKMLPGGNKLAGMEVDESQFKRTEAIICSMTMQERQTPASSTAAAASALRGAAARACRMSIACSTSLSR